MSIIPYWLIPSFIIPREKREPVALSDIEKRISQLLDTRFKFVELEDASSSFDLDDIGDEIRIERATGFLKRNSGAVK